MTIVQIAVVSHVMIMIIVNIAITGLMKSLLLNMRGRGRGRLILSLLLSLAFSALVFCIFLYLASVQIEAHLRM